MSNIQIYTDGALRKRNGLKGAWCCFVYNEQIAQLNSKIETTPDVTNNRMELSAVINGLKICPDKSTIDLYTDSQYVVFGITNGNSKTNQDLWQQYYEIVSKLHLTVNVYHVYGHKDNIGNNVVDLTMRYMLDMVIK